MLMVDKQEVNINDVALEHAAFAIRMSNSAPVECVAKPHMMCESDAGCVCRALAEDAVKHYAKAAQCTCKG
jgi:hypothetical protein